MEYKKAEIVAHTHADNPVKLSNIPFVFTPGERSHYKGADGSQSAIQGAGWLGLQTEPFEGWLGTYTIELSHPNGRNSDFVLEVTRTFHQPAQDEGWIWFPVKSLVAIPYTDHD